jgi:tRNA (guanine-N7-)-methyltransferase
MSNYGSLERFIPWRERSLPLDWAQECRRSAPVKVEIGFGNGDYLVRSAKDDPDANYVGIEMTWGSVWRALRSAHRAELSNLRVLLEDARFAITWAFQERSVTSFTSLFPCPWPKTRHVAHRLFSPSFLSLCNSRLVDEGSLTVVTDAPDYRDQMLKQITVANTGMSTALETIPASFGTKYERKWQAGGQQEFYRLTFRKVEHRSQPFPEITIVKQNIAANFDPHTFAPQSQKEPYVVLFKDFLYDPERQVAMQEVVTHEASVDQHFWIKIRKSEVGWKIAPAPGGPLLPLPSVQRALDLVHAASV